jgi:xylan 1,4-beta-xylosidase
MVLSLVLVAGSVGAQTINIDLRVPTVKRSQMWRFSIGSDRAMIFLRDEHQRDLKTLQAADSFQYLRCHGIFNEEMHIVTRKADKSLRFDWTNVDRFIDQLAAVKLRPFVECGFMPEALASDTRTIFWWKGNVTPPRSQDEWGQFIQAFAAHEISRRGADEVRQWYFEVWNEPNLDVFWTGGKEGYFQLYATTARAFKQVDPHLRVGGPATAGMAWIPELLAYCKDHSVPIDFVSSHSYAASEGFLDASGKGGTTLVTSPEALVADFARARHDIQHTAFPNLPLFITEWGPSYSPRDSIHDSYVCAPFILEKLRQSEKIVDGMSYWAFSDQFEEPGPPKDPFHGGFGLMNVDGLRKPAFFAYQFLAELDDAEIPLTSPHAIATKKGSSVRVLLWDYSPPRANAPDNPFYARDIPASQRPDAVLSFTGLPAGTYRVSRVGTGWHRNDVYDAYLALGKPPGKDAHLPADVLAKLQSDSEGKPEAMPELIVNSTGADATGAAAQGADSTGKVVIQLPMRTNDVWLLSLEKK